MLLFCGLNRTCNRTGTVHAVGIFLSLTGEGSRKGEENWLCKSSVQFCRLQKLLDLNFVQLMLQRVFRGLMNILGKDRANYCIKIVL